ncbi:hypothetical protein K227x_08980 [Rubripirellula lacrimiformis]|uniref:Uncharacterized protein n=1 Tax=Rubripirellula lacrimiformis TaxID=1930273 RepID=A0A517N5V1_9BACT|nr:hypothetical protein [Rubripirellula lacrimiformis]QDT02520.1 hypothetical protein K227x_08980 [Rubripirellula lacrimiformis]
MNDPVPPTSVDSKVAKPVQFSLRTILLVTAAFALSVAWYQKHTRLIEARSTAAMLASRARLLEIDDPSKITAVARLPTKIDETVFEVAIPNRSKTGRGHRICLTLEGLGAEFSLTQKKFPHPSTRLELTPGPHTIEVRHHKPASRAAAGQHEIELVIDGKVADRLVRPAVWFTTQVTSSSAVANCRSFDPDQRVELLRRRFLVDGNVVPSPTQANLENGILLWIERAK